MKELNLWETCYSRYYRFFSTLEDFFNYISKEDEITSSPLVTKERFDSSKDTPESLLEYIIQRDNTIVRYTNSKYPIAVHYGPRGLESYIDKSFLEQNKDKFKDFYKEKFEKQIKENGHNGSLIIPDIIIDEEILNIILENKKYRYYFYCFSDNHTKIDIKTLKYLKNNDIDFEVIIYYNSNVSKDEINELKENNIRINFFDEFERTKNYIDYFQKEYYDILKFENKNETEILLPYDKNKVKHLTYLNKDAKINVVPTNKNKNYTDDDYLDDIIYILKELEKYNKHYNMKIKFYKSSNDNNRLIMSKLLSNIPENINVEIIDEYGNVKHIDSYFNAEKKLESIAKHIRESNMSPFEKYMAVYNIVKNFKPYKKANGNNDNISRDLIMVLENGNDYIVCAGYANLLEDLLKRVGIPSMYIKLDVDLSYDDGYTIEEKQVKAGGHARNLIRIDDNKYNIHGYFIADSTWDNNNSIELYQNALMTFDRKKEATRLEFLSDIDLLMDFHNKDEFYTKIVYIIKQILKQKYNSEEYNHRIEVLEEICNRIMNILKRLDEEKYNELLSRYYIEDGNVKRYILKDKAGDTAFSFLEDYYKYIIRRVNKEVDINTIIKAAKESKRVLEGLSKEELDEWERTTLEDNIRLESNNFPYIYNPKDRIEAHLDDRPKYKK